MFSMFSIFLSSDSGKFSDDNVFLMLVLLALLFLCVVIFFIFFIINFTSKKRWHYILFNISGTILFVINIERIYEDMSYWKENSFKDYYRPSGLYSLLAFVFSILCCMLILWLFKRKQKLS